MKKFCPFCEQETNIEEINETEELEIRDEVIPVDTKYYRCQNCGEEFEIATEDNDPYAEAYREYRRRKGWPQPEEIKEFREVLGLTQQQFSDLLGIGVATLNRYENGALQSESNNSLISLPLRDPWVLLDFAQNNPNALSKSGLEDLKDHISVYQDGIPELLSNAIHQYGSYPPGIYSGGAPFDFRKFFEVAKILCYNTAQFTTKLQKLFFYVDFKHYKEYGHSITGMRYVRINYGPVPNEYKTWLAAMTEWVGVLESEHKEFDDVCGEEFTSIGVPDLSLFNPEEVGTIMLVKNIFEDSSATALVKFSHQEEGYKKTGHGQSISYEYAKTLQI